MCDRPAGSNDLGLELTTLWRVGEKQADEHWQVLLTESGAILRVVRSLQRLQVHPCAAWFRSEGLAACGCQELVNTTPDQLDLVARPR